MNGFNWILMKTEFDIVEFIENGKIQNELDLERALIMDRKLRVLSKKSSKWAHFRKRLRDLIEQYEKEQWNPRSIILEEKIHESDIAELIAERERSFLQRRRVIIRNKLKTLKLTQQDFGKILGHSSKSYISELMNGVSPFSLKDLIVIHQLFKIDLVDLVPTFLSQSEMNKIKSTIDELDNPHLKFDEDNLLVV